MNITVIGTDPPCPRCRETLHRVKQAAEEQRVSISIKKIVYSSDEAQRFGKVGTAHEIAEWAGLVVDWDEVKKLAAGQWKPELDEKLMLLKQKAEQEQWIMTPVVVIDDTVAFWGSVPTLEELKMLLRTHALP